MSTDRFIVTKSKDDNFGCFYALLREDARVEQHLKWIYPVMASYGETCYASIATLAEATGHGPKFCREAIQALVKAGWISIKATPPGQPVEYVLNGPSKVRDLVVFRTPIQKDTPVKSDRPPLSNRTDETENINRELPTQQQNNGTTKTTARENDREKDPEKGKAKRSPQGSLENPSSGGAAPKTPAKITKPTFDPATPVGEGWGKDFYTSPFYKAWLNAYIQTGLGVYTPTYADKQAYDRLSRLGVSHPAALEALKTFFAGSWHFEHGHRSFAAFGKVIQRYLPVKTAKDAAEMRTALACYYPLWDPRNPHHSATPRRQWEQEQKTWEATNGKKYVPIPDYSEAR